MQIRRDSKTKPTYTNKFIYEKENAQSYTTIIQRSKKQEIQTRQLLQARQQIKKRIHKHTRKHSTKYKGTSESNTAATCEYNSFC